MTTFSISVNGKEVIKKVPTDELEEQLKIVRGIVWTTGGSDSNIEVMEDVLKN